LEDHPIEGIRLQNIRMTFNGYGSLKDANQNPPELATGYPEPSNFGVMPAYGLYARHVKDLEISDVHFDLKAPDQRPAMVCEDVDGLQIDDMKAKLTKGVVPAWFYRVSDVTVRNSPQFVKVPTTRPTSQPTSQPSTEPATKPVE
jgi:hypothetical protein